MERIDANDASYRWLSEPRWYLWEGGFLLVASAQGAVPPHAHHAIQVVIALDEGRVAIRGHEGDWRDGRGIIVRPDVVHSFNAMGARAAMLFIDPESSEGAWLLSGVPGEITIVPDARLDSSLGQVRSLEEQPHMNADVQALIVHCVRAASAAEMAFLSPSRFAHLFRQQVGLPFSRYVLWRKLTRAMVAIGSEATIAAAAHAADFADAAHLTRTFYQMVGMAPSVLMRGEFAEIASPFGPADSPRPTNS